MVTMTTRSQHRRRKVRQDLAGTVPQAQPVSLSVTHSQVEASISFPGGLAEGHGPKCGDSCSEKVFAGFSGIRCHFGES